MNKNLANPNFLLGTDFSDIHFRVITVIIITYHRDNYTYHPFYKTAISHQS